MSRIPQVNLNDYLSGNLRSKEKFIKDLGKGFSEIGFVAVKGHLLNDEVKESLYKEVRQFFSEIPRIDLPIFGTELEIAQIVIEPKVSSAPTNMGCG